jgi:hypothetical protein
MKSFKDIRVAEARASISVGSADKKPENYRDPDGKIKVRMVPVKKTVVQYEAVDYEKLTQLARFGLVDKGNVQKLIAAFKKMEDGKILAPQQRELMLNVLTDLTGIITGDAQMFQKAKKAVKEGTLKEALDNLDIIAEAELDDYQKDKIMTAMLGKNHPYSPANMAKKKKKSAGFATWNKRDPKTGKLLNNSVEETKLDEDKLRFADEKTQKLRDRLDDLIFNVMITGNIEYDGKDNPTRHLKTIEKEFGPKVAKQVEAGMDIKNWGRDNRSSGIDRLALRKKSRISASGKMNKQDAVALGKRIMQDKSFGGLTKKVKLPEEAQIDEKTGVFGGDYTSKDHMMGMKNFMSIRDKKAKQRDAEHQAQDPKMAKMGYAKHMMDMDKAKSKAAKKGVNPSKTSRSDYETRNGMNPNRKLPEDAQIDEISMGKMAAYADKAVKSRNDAKARTHSADSNRRADAEKTLVKRRAGADNYNKKMWGYANVAPTKESVDEAKVGPSHDEIMKAIGNTQSSAQGMAILQKKFKLTAAQARKHMDMFLKDDVQIDEMGAFMSKPLPTPMSMRKDTPMTRPLMLTPQMSKAAELIKKAGNTPKLPTNGSYIF